MTRSRVIDLCLKDEAPMPLCHLSSVKGCKGGTNTEGHVAALNPPFLLCAQANDTASVLTTPWSPFNKKYDAHAYTHIHDGPLTRSLTMPPSPPTRDLSQVAPITVLKSEYREQVVHQIVSNNSYICYGLKQGHIRVLNKVTANRALLKGHASMVSYGQHVCVCMYVCV
jgi:hypothetical protein